MYCAMTLTVQIRVMELETDLEKERRKLGELRKQHYQLAGEAEGWEVVCVIIVVVLEVAVAHCVQCVCVGWGRRGGW